MKTNKLTFGQYKFLINKVKKLGKTSDKFKTVVTAITLTAVLFGFGAGFGTMQTDIEHNVEGIRQNTELIEEVKDDTIPRTEVNLMFDRFDEILDRLEDSVEKIEDKEK